MKKMITPLAALLLLCCSTSLIANVFRVNNNLPTDKNQKIYNTIAAAHSDALVMAGDTLMIEGSGTVYADITLTKRLVLIGPGYLLTQNPQTQASSAQAVVSNITIQPAAAGTVLIGLTFSDYYSSNLPSIQGNNVIIMRCYLPHGIQILGNVNNIQILQNYLSGSNIANYYSDDKFTGVTVKNNIISSINISSPINSQRSFDAVEGNIFLNSISLTASTFRNNIIVNKSATVNIVSSNIQNNLVSNNQLSGNGNQTYNDTQLFIGNTGNSPDGQYKLKPDSPYKLAGYNNTEPGIYGGSQPYVLSGIPPIPSIYEFTADGFASKQSGLQINIKVKANQ